MGCGCNSINNTCGETHYAACTQYEGALPVFTTLAEANCYTLEEVIADIYLIETAIKDEIDLSALLGNGITYTLVSGEVIAKNALEAHADLLVTMQAQLTGLVEGTDELFNITDWALNLGCIADICNNPPTTLVEYLQLLNDAVCINENKNGVLDYNDLFTQSTPLTIGGGGGEVHLTNDGLGSFTNKAYPPFGVTDVWNASLNVFDFSELRLGGVVHLRLDCEITTTNGNQEVETAIDLAISGSPYTIGINRTQYKAAGTYQLHGVSFIYLGDENTRLSPAKFKIISDGALTIKVNGWACSINNY
jgi:hypothetical protein